MQKLLLLSPRHRWVLAVGTLSASPLFFDCHALHAQVSTAAASASATINPNGPRTGTGGTNFFNAEAASNGANATFGVLDFSSSTLNPSGQTASGVQGNTLTLALTESNAAFTAPTSLEFYLTTATGTSIVAGTSALKYNGTGAGDASTPLFGIDTGLGALGGNAAGTLFDLGTGSFTTTQNPPGSTGTTDTYTLTLGAGLSTFLAELNAAGGNVRLVVASTSASGAATFFGATNTTNNTTTYKPPTLSFSATFAVGNPLNWQGGNGGSWTPTGTTNWSNGAGGSTQWDNGGTATAVFGGTGQVVNINAGNINAAGLEFDVSGYTVNGTGAGNTLTLTGNHSVNVVNAADTATINAPIAGTAGLSKLGAGTLVLGGANTYSGNTTLTGGTVAISAAANLGANGNGVVFNGGTLAVANTLNSLGGGRAFTGTGGGLAYSGTTPLVINGDVTLTGTLALTGTGSVTLGDASGRGYDTIAGLGIANAITVTSTGTLNTSGISATQASGTAVINGNVALGGTTNNVNVASAGATLQVTGGIATGTATAGGGFTTSAGVLVKQGAGTLDLLGDNTFLSAATATSGAVRQGVAGTAPASGGTIMVHTATGLGTGQYQLNSGAFVNASGGMLTFANGLSIGGGQLAGGATFGGTAGASSTFTGAVSLFNPTGSVYQHVITVNAPTTFTGVFSSATTGTNGGLLIAGTSSLTLAPAAGAPNTFTEDVTIAGGTTLTLATTGALGANRSVSLLSNALLTFTLGTGVQDAVNDAAFVSLGMGSRITLNGDNETVGGLAINGMQQLPGTYGATGSGATTESEYFTGSGILINLGTTAPIPEPSSAWLAAAGLSSALAGWLLARRRRDEQACRGEC